MPARLRARVAVTRASPGNALDRTGLTDLRRLALFPQAHRSGPSAMGSPLQRVEPTGGRRCVT